MSFSTTNHLLLLGLGLVATATACFERDGGKMETGKQARRSPTPASKVKSKLSSLPYVNWVPVKPEDRGRRGVIRHDPKRAYQGLNLYNSMPRARAQLMDMYGKTVHGWASSAGQPTRAEREWQRIWSHLDFSGWQHVRATPEGELYAIIHLHGLLKLDRDSKVEWLAEVAAHHDLDVAEDGDVYTLTAEKRKIVHRKTKLWILDDHVVVLDRNGKLRRRISLLDVLLGDPATRAMMRKKLDWAAKSLAGSLSTAYLMANALQKNKRNVKRTAEAFRLILADRFRAPRGRAEPTRSPARGRDEPELARTRRIELMLMTVMLPMDPIHANAVQVLQRDVEGLGKKGDLLLSVRELNLVLVLDPKTTKVRWTFGPRVLQRQHQPSLLESGNVLIFDNGTFSRRSRVLEVRPDSRQVVWSYQANPPQAFFSPIRGGAQRLPNGNTLIVESERGRVFEVTREARLVWEFFNPDLKDPYMRRRRAPIYRMTRLPPDFLQRKTGAAPQKGPR